MSVTRSDDGVALYDSEDEATRRAEELTREWEQTDGDRGYRAYAFYSVSRGGWIVHRRPGMPGILT